MWQCPAGGVESLQCSSCINRCQSARATDSYSTGAITIGMQDLLGSRTGASRRQPRAWVRPQAVRAIGGHTLECIRSAFRFVLAHAPFGIIACRGAWGNYSNVRREMIDPIGELYGLDEGQSGQSKCASTWAEQRARQPSVSNFSLAEKTFGISGRLQTRFRMHPNPLPPTDSQGRGL